jgi:hypothetical protein
MSDQADGRYDPKTEHERLEKKISEQAIRIAELEAKLEAAEKWNEEVVESHNKAVSVGETLAGFISDKKLVGEYEEWKAAFEGET